LGAVPVFADRQREWQGDLIVVVIVFSDFPNISDALSE